MCLTHSEAKQTKTLEFGAEKCLMQGPSKEYGWLMLKRPKLTGGFQGSVFKGKMRERVTRCMISSFIIFWLVDGEAYWKVVSQGLTSSVLSLQPVWGLCAHGHHAVSFSHLVGFYYLQDNSGMCIRHCCPCSLRRSQRFCDSAIWLIYFLNCYQFSWPNCCFFVTTFSQSSNH